MGEDSRQGLCLRHRHRSLHNGHAYTNQCIAAVRWNRAQPKPNKADTLACLAQKLSEKASFHDHVFIDANVNLGFPPWAMQPLRAPRDWSY